MIPHVNKDQLPAKIASGYSQIQNGYYNSPVYIDHTYMTRPGFSFVTDFKYILPFIH